jgi:hypothetical protein
MELYSHSEGAPLSEIEAFTEELTGIMEEMKEKLANEGKILEGTEMPTREAPDELWATLMGKNELSQVETKEDQWNKPSQSGSSTIDPSLTSSAGSSISASIVKLFNRGCPIRRSSGSSWQKSTSSSEEMQGVSGSEIGVTSELSDSTEQTINVPMAGTQSEEK